MVHRGVIVVVSTSMMLAACALSRDGTFDPGFFGAGNTSAGAGGASTGTFGSTGDGGKGDGGKGDGGTGAGDTGNDGEAGAGGLGGNSELPPVVWNSWNVVTNGSAPQVSGGGYATTIEFYRSVSLTDLTVDATFNQYHAGPHPESFNHLEMYWALGTNPNTYPYAGKSTADRGSDNGETAAPLPLYVRDLQLHPPNSDHLVVMAFVTPLTANYTVTGLALRRVDDRGSLASLELHAPCNATSIEKLQASNNQAWVVSTQVHALASVNAGERICFGVARVDNYGWDAVEIAWTITAQP